MCQNLPLLLASALGLVLSCLTGPVEAANDLLETYQAARTNDPRFQVAFYEYEAAKEAIPQARAELLPGVTLDLRGAETKQNILDRNQAIFGEGRTRFTTKSYSFQASQPLFRVSSWQRLRQAKTTVKQAFALFAVAEQQLLRRSAEAYLIVLAARDNVALSKAELAAVGRQLELVKARRRGGLANITDEYEAQARYSRVQADVFAGTNTLDDAYQGLREVVGDAVVDIYPFREDIPMVTPDPPNVSSWIDMALDQNWSLLAANYAVTVSEQEIKRRRASHFPTLDLVARTGNIDSGGAITGGGSDVDTTEVALQLTIPLFAGGGISSLTRQAQSDHRRAIEERRLQHRIVMRETRAAFQSLSSAISRVAALRDSLRSQESALGGREQGYRSGVNTLLDVLDAQRDLNATRRDYYTARYDYLMNLLRLKEQVGALSENDLAYINQFLNRT
ncbi:MAG: TolC family outer membrane protein [Gammaproteobacteria bacterium]|nr:TolC family outer membrane protein [Gammaproteobacteria bacterium]